MLAETGLFALILALICALLQAVIPFAAPTGPAAGFSRRAAYTQGALVTLAFALLISAHALNDFSLQNVAENSHTGKPLLFAIAGAWGNHEGSMLLWGFVLAVFGAAFAAARGSLAEKFHSHALALHGVSAALFLGYILTASNPFTRLDPAPLNGLGLNPLLQDVGLAIHPPLLYLGYVGFSVVFALAGAALIAGKLDKAAASAIRRWSLIAWLFLTLGIGFGAWWSYYTLGWGGFWSWDPVENAALLPWLTGLALIHACGPAKAGALKRWTLFLALSCFVFSLMGTFLVRSGVLVSVHSFATDPLRGLVILGLLAVLAGGGYLLFALRAPKIRGDIPIAPRSRNGGLFIASLIAAACAFIVAVGTLYPLVLEGLTGARITVGAPYFNSIFKILMLPVLALMTLGPQLGKPLKSLMIPAAIGVLAACGFWLWQGEANWSGAIIGLSAFSLLSFKKNQPGGATAHGGVAVMMLGIALVASLSGQSVYHMAPGDSVAFDGWQVTLESIHTRPVENYTSEQASLRLHKGDTSLWLQPQRRRYAHPEAEKPVPAIHTSLIGDMYAVLGARGEDGRVDIALIRHPGQIWIFTGMALMALGGLVALARRKRRRQKTAVPQPSAILSGRRIGPVLPVTLFLILLILFGQHFAHRLYTPPPDPTDSMIGQKLPDFALPPVQDGQPWLKSADLAGHVSLINIFASWCVPCHEEAPFLMELKADGAKIYGIAWRDGQRPLQDFLKKTGNPYAATGMDAKGRAVMDLGATGVPETFLIDKNGIIRWHHAGPLDAATIRKDILPLMRREM